MAATIRPDRILAVDSVHPQWDRIRLAAAAIRRGEVLAIPTDTVYGLAGDPFQPMVAQQIFRMKRRRESQPILLLIANFGQLGRVAYETPLLRRLADMQLRAGDSLTLNNILFDQGKSELRPASLVELDRIAAFMRDNPAAEIELSGHTSSEGDAAMNRSLSYARVRACRD